jgi:hypothetical protein
MRASIFLPKSPSRRLEDEMADSDRRSELARVTLRARVWDAERIAAVLGPRRDQLVDRLPVELAAARGLTHDEHETVIDEAIDFMVTQYDKPILDRESLDRAFWATAAFRVKRVHDGRSATVRAGWGRVDIDAIDVASPDEDPANALVHAVERAALLEFAATLTEVERRVFACKYGEGPRELGWRVVARRLSLPTAEIRRTERSIKRKLDRFVAILAAGSLCAQRAVILEALAAGVANEQQELVARMHLDHCAACRAAYATHLRALRSGDLQHRIAELLPVPAMAVAERRQRGGPWDALSDWISRPFGSDSVSTGAQLAAGARGLGAAAATKLAALCIGGVVAVGGATFCATTLLQSKPPAPDRVKPAATPSHAAGAKEPHLPSAGRTLAALRAREAARAKRASVDRSRATGSSRDTGDRASRHERAAAVSPPAGTASTSGDDEFAPAPANQAPPGPAPPPPSAMPEFP